MLVEAACQGDAVKVRTLLATPGSQSFINYHDADWPIPPPIYCAAANGHASVAKQLIAARCNVDLQAENGWTPIHMAAQEGHAAVTEELLAARCNVDHQADDGATPLHVAAANGHAGITKKLLAVHCNVDFQDNSEIAKLIWSKGLETPLLGRRVVINGLVAKPEHNGRTGTAVSFDDNKGHTTLNSTTPPPPC